MDVCVCVHVRAWVCDTHWVKAEGEPFTLFIFSEDQHQEWLLETQITQQPGSTDSCNSSVSVIRERLGKMDVLHESKLAPDGKGWMEV